jgi:hypothetical protein
MKIRLIKSGVAAALLACAFAANAAPLSEWRDIGDFQQKASASGLATTFQDTQGLATGFDAGDASSDFTLAGQTADAASQSSGKARVQSAALSDTGSIAPVNASLWNFIWNVRAQQTGDQFMALETSSTNIDITLNNVPAAVPLPDSFWLFVAGVAGFGVFRAFVVRGRREMRAGIVEACA